VSKDILDEQFPEAPRVKVGMDNLNPPTPASLSEGFPPDEARRLAAKLDLHYPPKHGSWLDMAEVEISVFTGQCFERRIPAVAQWEKEVAAWEHERNPKKATVEWRFTRPHARNKLPRLYPLLAQEKEAGITCQN